MNILTSATSVKRMTSRPCSEPGCPNFAGYKGRCKEHARQNDKQINRAGRSIYATKRWKLLRRRKLTQDFTCEYVDPDEGPCQRPATDVHHRIAIAEGGPKWELQNLEALCAKHHGWHTRQEQLSA